MSLLDKLDHPSTSDDTTFLGSPPSSQGHTSFAERLRSKRSQRPDTVTFNLSECFVRHKRAREESSTPILAKREEIISTQPPSYRAVYKSLKVVYEKPFPWISKWPLHPAKFCKVAMSAINNNHVSSDIRIPPVQSIEELLASALLQWRLVPSSMCSLASQSLKSESDSLEILEHGALVEWISAFRSVFFRFKSCREASQFCIHTSSWNAWVYFVKECGKEHVAVISRSYPRLRRALREHRIQFSLPLKHNQDEGQVDDDILEFEKSTGMSVSLPALGTSNGCESLVVIEGMQNLHLFYDFLLNSPIVGNIPSLYAWEPFIHSESVMLPGRIREIQAPSKAFVFEIKGYIPPLNITRIHQFLEKHLPGPWECQAKAIECSTGLEEYLNSNETLTSPLTKALGFRRLSSSKYVW